PIGSILEMKEALKDLETKDQTESVKQLKGQIEKNIALASSENYLISQIVVLAVSKTKNISFEQALSLFTNADLDNQTDLNSVIEALAKLTPKMTKDQLFKLMTLADSKGASRAAGRLAAA